MNDKVHTNSKQNDDNDKTDVDRQCTLYRTKLIGESNIWANMTVYHAKNYKLITDNAVSSFSECATPDDNCGITLSQSDNTVVRLDDKQLVAGLKNILIIC